MEPVSPALQDLIRKVAVHPHGLGFLHQATLESVAVTLGVSPFVAAQARAFLETPEGRAFMIEGVRRAREEIPEGPDPSIDSRSEAPPDLPSNPKELIEAARRHSLGEGFLREGALESVAITFGVHPLMVLAAREILGSSEQLPEM